MIKVLVLSVLVFLAVVQLAAGTFMLFIEIAPTHDKETMDVVANEGNRHLIHQMIFKAAASASAPYRQFIAYVVVPNSIIVIVASILVGRTKTKKSDTYPSK